MRRLLSVLAILCLIAAGCGSGAEPSPGSQGTPEPETPGSRAGRDRVAANAAPDFSITTFTGDRFSLGEQRGTPVVLNFWESW